MLPAPFRYRAYFVPLLIAAVLPLVLTHCAASKDPSQPANEAASANKPGPLVLGPKDLLHITPIAVPESCGAVLEAYGWDTTRFTSQLHAEAILAMRHRGIGTTGDSAAATAHLAVRVNHCERDGGIRYAAEAVLRKAEVERVVQLSREASLSTPPAAEGAAKPENAASEEVDPALYGMKRFAKTLADEVTFKPPTPPAKAKRKRSQESAVPMNFMLF